jgi:hypothetical protein
MKYSVETDKNGYVETLEVNGKKYLKRWKQTDSGASCEDAEFYEQLEADGICDDEFLDMVCDEIDNDFFASDIYDISKLV